MSWLLDWIRVFLLLIMLGALSFCPLRREKRGTEAHRCEVRRWEANRILAIRGDGFLPDAYGHFSCPQNGEVFWVDSIARCPNVHGASHPSPETWFELSSRAGEQ